MKFGTRLTQLGEGDILVSGLLQYQGLDGISRSGVDAASAKLQDTFFKLYEAGITWVIDSITPQLDSAGNISWDNVFFNTKYGNDWSFDQRALLYQELSNRYNIEVVVQINFPGAIGLTNHEQYVNFVTSAINYMPWVKYWQIGARPEISVAQTTPINQGSLVDPELYVTILREIYNSAKIGHPNIHIMGPGIGAGLIQTNNDVSNMPMMQQSYNNDWLNRAINAGLLYYCDIFTLDSVQASANDVLNFQGELQNFGNDLSALNDRIEQVLGKQLPIFVIDQGSSSYNVGLKEQAYNDIVEIMSMYYYGLPDNNPNITYSSEIPQFMVFKNQFLDRVPLEQQFADLKDEDLNYGMVALVMNDNVESMQEKDIYVQYKFLINSISNQGYSMRMTVNNQTSGLPIYIYTFSNDFQNQSVAVVMSGFDFNYPISPVTPVRVMKLDGTTITLNTASTIPIGMAPTVVITSIINEVLASFTSRQNFITGSLQNLISLLPDSYNKEITDTNYYKLLRSIAIELGTAKEAVNILKNNLYIDQAEGDALYNNFGALISLPRDSSWDDDKYRYIIKGIMNALLKGPTVENMEHTISMFTGYDVRVHELYNNDDPYVQNLAIKGNQGRYAFAVEVIKTLGDQINQEDLTSEANYVVGIIKPAHTLSYIVVTLMSEDKYQDYYQQAYNQDFASSDALQRFEQNSLMGDNTFGWKGKSYTGQFMISNPTVYGVSGARIGGPLLIGPRYTLYDNSIINLENFPFEYKSLSSNMPTAFRLGPSNDPNMDNSRFPCLNMNPMFYPDQVEQVVLPDVQFSIKVEEPTEAKSEYIELLPVDDYASDSIAPRFQFNLTPLNVTPLAIREPAVESLETYGQFLFNENKSIVSDPNSWFVLSSSTLNNFILSQGSIDNSFSTNIAYSELQFKTPVVTEAIATYITEEPMPVPEADAWSELDLPEDEDHTDHFFNQGRFFMTNLSLVNNTQLMSGRNEVEEGPSLEFTHDSMPQPQVEQTISTGYAEKVYGEGQVFMTNFSATSTVTYSNGQPQFHALTRSIMMHESDAVEVGYSELDIVKTNGVQSLILNNATLNNSVMFPCDYDVDIFEAENVASDEFPTPQASEGADYILSEASYLELPGMAFMTNLIPLGHAVLGQEQRVADQASAIEADVHDDIATYHSMLPSGTQFDVTSGELDRTLNEVQFPTPVSVESSTANHIYVELKYGYLASSNNLFMTNSSASLSTASILYALTISADMSDMQMDISERTNIRPRPMFMLNNVSLNSNAFNVTSADTSTAEMFRVNPDGSTTVLATYAA